MKYKKGDKILISSNNGWEKVVFHLNDVFHVDGMEYLLFNLLLLSKFWNRKKLLKNKYKELVEDKIFKFPQLLVPRLKWDEFLQKIDNWIDANELFFTELSSIDGRRITLELKESPELISSVEKPVLEVIVIDGKGELQWKCIVDKTLMSIY